MGRLDGRVALISGAAKGQGAAEARLFAREGASVVLSDILDAEGEKVAEEIRAIGGSGLYIHLDATREVEWHEAVQRTVASYGKLDILINNAGIVIRSGIEETSEADWDRVMAVNAKSAFLGTKHAIPAMRQAGGGAIVNVSSTGGLAASATLGAPYSASKAAVHLLTKTTALQHAKDNIRCNSVHPGPIATEMLEAITSNPELLAEYRRRIPLGRLGEAGEVAAAVLFLASDDASFITGTELVIDGGMLAQ